MAYDQFKKEEDGIYHVQIKIFHKDVRQFIESDTTETRKTMRIISA